MIIGTALLSNEMFEVPCIVYYTHTFQKRYNLLSKSSSLSVGNITKAKNLKTHIIAT